MTILEAKSGTAARAEDTAKKAIPSGSATINSSLSLSSRLAFIPSVIRMSGPVVSVSVGGTEDVTVSLTQLRDEMGKESVGGRRLGQLQAAQEAWPGGIL